MDNVTRSKILGNMTTERDLRNQMRYATETGMAEGRAEIIKRMNANGMSALQISELTDINLAEIEAILA